MAIGDGDKGKVDLGGANAPPTDELLSSDENSPIIIESDELVCSEETNPSLYSTIYNELILCYQTNIILGKLRAAHPEIVCRLETILKTERGGEIAAMIHEAQVFATPTLIHLLANTHNLTYKRAKPYVYEVKKTLEIEGIIEWTPYEAVHPNPRYPGPRAHFYKLTGIELNGSEDPLIKKAQREFEECPLRYDKQAQVEWSARDRLSRVSMLIADQLIGKGEKYPNPDNIIDTIIDDYPEVKGLERKQVLKMVSVHLREHREASP